MRIRRYTGRDAQEAMLKVKMVRKRGHYTKHSKGKEKRNKGSIF